MNIGTIYQASPRMPSPITSRIHQIQRPEMRQLSLYRRYATKNWGYHRDHDVVQLVLPEGPVGERVLHAVVQVCSYHLGLACHDADAVEVLVEGEVDGDHHEPGDAEVVTDDENPCNLEVIGLIFG